MHKQDGHGGFLLASLHDCLSFLDTPEQVEEEQGSQARTETRTRPSTVVAPAVRSTSPKRIKLKASQVALARKLGLTPEQYAHEQRKLEAQNG